MQYWQNFGEHLHKAETLGKESSLVLVFFPLFHLFPTFSELLSDFSLKYFNI